MENKNETNSRIEMKEKERESRPFTCLIAGQRRNSGKIERQCVVRRAIANTGVAGKWKNVVRGGAKCRR